MDDQIRVEEATKSSFKGEWRKPEITELITDETENNPGIIGSDGAPTPTSQAS